MNIAMRQTKKTNNMKIKQIQPLRKINYHYQNKNKTNNLYNINKLKYKHKQTIQHQRHLFLLNEPQLS